jgi:hypothetical protein
MPILIREYGFGVKLFSLFLPAISIFLYYSPSFKRIEWEDSLTRATRK